MKGKTYMRYEYLNKNPKQKKAGDCVIRAISAALDQSWEKTYADLCAIGVELCRMPNDRVVWGRYLESKGWVKCPELRDPNNKRFTIEQAHHYLRPVQYIINAGNLHVTYSNNNTLYDTWDCRRKIMHSYWRKK